MTNEWNKKNTGYCQVETKRAGQKALVCAIGIIDIVIDNVLLIDAKETQRC